MTDHLDRSIAAEARAVEEGHHAFLARDDDGVFVRVKSDSVDGRWYRVVAHALGGEGVPITFTCRASDIGAPGRRKDHGNGIAASVDGTTSCKHMALAARRLERAGLIRWVDPHVADGIAYCGRWVAARPTSPVVTDELAADTTPAEALAEIATWRTVPAVTAHGMGIVTPWTERVTHASPAEFGRSSVRRATDSAGYRRTVGQLDPGTAQAFATFEGSDR